MSFSVVTRYGVGAMGMNHSSDSTELRTLVENIKPSLANPGALLWIDLQDPNEDEFAALFGLELYGFKEKYFKQEMHNLYQKHPVCSMVTHAMGEENFIQLSLSLIDPDSATGDLRVFSISAILHQNVLITCSKGGPNLLKQVTGTHVAIAKASDTAEELLTRVLDFVLDLAFELVIQAQKDVEKRLEISRSAPVEQAVKISMWMEVLSTFLFELNSTKVVLANMASKSKLIPAKSSWTSLIDRVDAFIINVKSNCELLIWMGETELQLAIKEAQNTQATLQATQAKLMHEQLKSARRAERLEFFGVTYILLSLLLMYWGRTPEFMPEWFETSFILITISLGVAHFLFKYCAPTTRS